MNKPTIFLLKAARKIYAKFNPPPKRVNATAEELENASQMIYELLEGTKPCMIARFGANELSATVNYIGVSRGKKEVMGFINGRGPSWWWERNIITQMQQCAGFFPPTQEKVAQFARLTIEDARQIDILGSWQPNERLLATELSEARRIDFTALDPFWSKKPWTRALKGKKVLVVHPFTETIESQYRKRELLFENPDILPAFELHTVKAVQSIGGAAHGFADWFEALDHMKAQIDRTDYDICLLGCGAYGFSLAAHVKRQGKKAIHWGGKLQLLFGIRGKRWDNPAYNTTYSFVPFINEHWVRPSENEKPSTAQHVEGGCYW